MKWLSRFSLFKESGEERKERKLFKFSVTPITPDGVPGTPFFVASDSKEELSEIRQHLIEEAAYRATNVFKFDTHVTVGDTDKNSKIFRVDWLIRLRGYTVSPIEEYKKQLFPADFVSNRVLFDWLFNISDRNEYFSEHLSVIGGVDDWAPSILFAVNLSEKLKYVTSYKQAKYVELVIYSMKTNTLDDIYPPIVTSSNERRLVFDDTKKLPQYTQHMAEIDALLDGKKPEGVRVEFPVGNNTFIFLTVSEE